MEIAIPLCQNSFDTVYNTSYKPNDCRSPRHFQSTKQKWEQTLECSMLSKEIDYLEFVNKTLVHNYLAKFARFSDVFVQLIQKIHLAWDGAKLHIQYVNDGYERLRILIDDPLLDYQSAFKRMELLDQKLNSNMFETPGRIFIDIL